MFRGFRSALRDIVSGYLRVSIKSCVGDPTAWERDYRERQGREMNAPAVSEAVHEEHAPQEGSAATPRSPVSVRF